MCQKVVGGISLLLGLLGIVTLAFGAMSSGGMPPAMTKIMGDKKFGGGGGGPMLALGALVFLTSILGCATAKFKNPCFAMPFGLLTFIFGLALFIIGALAMVIASPQAGKVVLQEVCKSNSPAVQFDTQYNSMVVKPLCSEVCPCEQAKFDAWQKTTTDAAVRSNGRTFKLKTSSERSDQSRNGIGAKMVELKALKTGKTYNDFMACYDGVLKDAKPTTKNNGQKMKEWFKTNGVDGLTKMEKELDCGGACKAPLFYVTRPFDEQPQQTCFKSLAAKFQSGARMVGVVCILTALVSFCAFCGSFPLCTKFNEEEGEGKRDAE